MNRGTPTSLEQAIFNAFEDAGMVVSAGLVEGIKLSVKDFIAQKFSIAHLTKAENEDVLLQDLYNNIMSKSSKAPNPR